MASSLSLDAAEQDLTFMLMEALMGSFDLSVVLKRAYGVISRMLAADHAAICIPKPGSPTEYEWLVAEMPAEFFAHYGEVASEDFVRHTMAKQPNVVLRDTEMVSSEQLKRSAFCQRSHELGMPPEHMMAVMLQVDQDWHSGFMLYRGRPTPFSDRERAVLQRLASLLASTVRNCRMMGEVQRQMGETQRQLMEAHQRRWVLEQLLSRSSSKTLVMVEPATEMMRTDGVTELLERWFAPSEFEGLLPKPLVERLRQLAGSVAPVGSQQEVWERENEGRSLRVTFIPLLAANGRRLWTLMLQEIPDAVPVPKVWQGRLTRRELQVVERLLKGWGNLTIAEDLGCTESTVKKHLQRIFDKLGADTRAMVQSMATRLDKT
ncbi:helix-turn-helix transcriptional regulator [Hyalangium rubrum]|uniref:Helix-turn-helix transcriptional regulator n=1 Tax=Hyalangium rubrum TaxID=3103134 RepID=A0ABU5H031_9BACT|nr:helix-turn-helix transcriptional regulator [Hyalangium sp. s54d21]MDY7226479.1 helix-turn-helix transcriptional regulator [Hyalangium sp. s54d21]